MTDNRQRRTLLAVAAFAFLAPGGIVAQDFDRFPGFAVAARADQVYVTGNVLARLDDGACSFGPEILVEEAQRALLRNGFSAIVLRQPAQPPAIVEGIGLDVSALVLPVLGTEACAVSTRIQLTIGGDAVLLAAEHFNLLTWTATGLLSRVRASVNRDASAMAGALRRERDGPPGG